MSVCAKFHYNPSIRGCMQVFGSNQLTNTVTSWEIYKINVFGLIQVAAHRDITRWFVRSLEFSHFDQRHVGLFATGCMIGDGSHWELDHFRDFHIGFIFRTMWLRPFWPNFSRILTSFTFIPTIYVCMHFLQYQCKGNKDFLLVILEIKCKRSITDAFKWPIVES